MSFGERKAPLRRTGFKRKAPAVGARPRQRKPVARQSPKRITEQAEYDALHAELLPPGEFVPCSIGPKFEELGVYCCTGKATELNHRRKRSSSGALANPANVEPSCHACNMEVERRPEMAKVMGSTIRPGHPEWEALSARAWRQR